MANNVGFEGANKIFRAPKNMENCVDLEVFQDETQIISCHRLTPEELEEVNRTGVVWLSIIGQGIPPLLVSGTALVQTDGKPAIAEPYIPKARKGGTIPPEAG